jgi:dynein heavy chain, axonemal
MQHWNASSVQELGKAFGMQTIVFNCGRSLDPAFMASFLSGIAQCGAFACFDEFNRIDVEVLLHFRHALAT